MEKVKAALDTLGFTVTRVAKRNENGPDVWALKDGQPYSFEVKHARILRAKTSQIPPVEKGRRDDDFIAIVLPSGYVLVEPMKDHLKSCSPKGYRTLRGMA